MRHSDSSQYTGIKKLDTTKIPYNNKTHQRERIFNIFIFLQYNSMTDKQSSLLILFHDDEIPIIDVHFQKKKSQY